MERHVKQRGPAVKKKLKEFRMNEESRKYRRNKRNEDVLGSNVGTRGQEVEVQTDKERRSDRGLSSLEEPKETPRGP